MEHRRLGLATRALHVGQGPDPSTGSVVVPIHLATTFAQESPGRHKGFEYSRSGNPTRGNLEECLASLENAEHGLAFSSGLAATTAVLLLLDPGDHVVFTEDVYGGTFRLFVKVFQRTPGWVLPRLDVATPPAVQTVFAKAPAVQQLARQALYWGHEASATALVWDTPLTSLVARLGKMHLRRQVKDPWLRRQLTPDFTPGCKRMLVSSDYYPALQRDNCKLIDWPIATLSPVGLRTSDGIEHHVDCIVFATGYDVHLTGPPFPVTGLGGRSLSAEWVDGAQAYKSASAHGYPNLFLMTGPNSGPGHNSLLVYIEGQLDYAVRGITTILDSDLRYLDVRHDVQRRYNERIQRRLTKTTWMSGCSSWYLTNDGRNVSMYPGFATQYLRQMRDFQYADYDAVEHTAARVSSSA